MRDFDLFPPQFSTDSGWKTALHTWMAGPKYPKLVEFITSQYAQHEVFPKESEVFFAMQTTALHRVRVVIVGQDPYPTPGHACGLAFGVSPGVAPPASLRNIFLELQREGLLAHIPTSGNLISWAQQGVLLLNTCLTVRAGEPGSHAGQGWEDLAQEVLKAVNQLPERVVFLLWGNHARRFESLIEAPHVALVSSHPSPLSVYRGFNGCGHFLQANQLLHEAGRAPIRWDDIH
jgi:uracil-DNA glycosylase